MKYLDNAPPRLRDMHENNKEGQAKKLLGMLLSNPDMFDVWKRLGRQIKTDNEWIKLWQAIKSAIYNASPKKTTKLVKDEADDFREIEKQAKAFAKLIRTVHQSEVGRWHFDLECYEFFPEEIKNINNSNPGFQHGCWPRMGEMLDALATQASEKAKTVAASRIVGKKKTRWAETMFIRCLYRHLSKYSWKNSDSLFVNITEITNIVIEEKLLKCSKDSKDSTVTSQFTRTASKAL